MTLYSCFTNRLFDNYTWQASRDILSLTGKLCWDGRHPVKSIAYLIPFHPLNNAVPAMVSAIVAFSGLTLSIAQTIIETILCDGLIKHPFYSATALTAVAALAISAKTYKDDESLDRAIKPIVLTSLVIGAAGVGIHLATSLMAR